MAVEKFRSHEDARKALHQREGALAPRIEALWNRSGRLAIPWISPGLLKFRSIEDAGQHRETMIRHRVGQLRESRNAAPGNHPDA